MKNYLFLFWAYNAIWLGLAGYLLSLLVRTRRMRRRLDALERELARTGPEGGGSEQ